MARMSILGSAAAAAAAMALSMAGPVRDDPYGSPRYRSKPVKITPSATKAKAKHKAARKARKRTRKSQ